MQKIAALDGIRAISVLLVIAFHARAPVAGGWIGVDVFFVLSGFLITAILRDEVSSRGSVDLFSFYRRRFARLYPAFLMLLFLYVLIAPHAWPDYSNHYRDALFSALYLADISPSFGQAAKYLRHTWSLSVEMHFYILWPLIVLWTRRLSCKHMVMLLICAYAISSGWRAFSAEYSPWREVYFTLDTRLSGLMLGALTAVAWRSGLLPKPRPYLWIVAITTLAAAGLLSQWRNPIALGLGPFAAEISAAILIVCAIKAPNQVRWMEFAPLQYLGKISYGAYLFHYPIIVWLRADMSWPATLVIGGAATIVLAVLSYHTVEPWFRLGRINRKPDCWR